MLRDGQSLTIQRCTELPKLGCPASARLEAGPRWCWAPLGFIENSDHMSKKRPAGRLSLEQEQALNYAVEQRDSRVSAALRVGGGEVEGEQALLSLARRVASERK